MNTARELGVQPQVDPREHELEPIWYPGMTLCTRIQNESASCRNSCIWTGTVVSCRWFMLELKVQIAGAGLARKDLL